MNIRPGALLLLPALLAGCVLSTRPPDDAGFARAGELSEFSGCYANESEPYKNGIPRRLSVLMWPGSDLDHDAVETVAVESEGKDVLHVSAIGGSAVLMESRYRRGKDFRFTQGQIRLKTKPVVATGLESGNPAIGLGYERLTLGIDKADNGRVEEEVGFVGTAFLVFPLAVVGSDVARFSRLASCDSN